MRIAGIAATIAVVCCLALADDADDLAAQSLALRTALHHDPTLASPVERLVALYREKNMTDQLIGIYRSHVRQYPEDLKAVTVLARILTALDDPEAGPLLEKTAARYSTNGYIHYLRYEYLKRNHSPGALDALARAIEHEKAADRKLSWIDDLVAQALMDGRRELAAKQADVYIELSPATADGKLATARKMNEHKFHERALAQCKAAAAAEPSPETMVDIELTAAYAENAMGRRQQAAARLDALLGKLTTDYWRREEVLSRRISLAQTEREREVMLEAARKRLAVNPKDETAILDLAQHHSGFGYRQKALDVLRDAGKQRPDSVKIEKATLAAFDLVGDREGKAAYVEERRKRYPARKDLALEQVRVLYATGKSARAREVLAGIVKGLAKAEQVTCCLDLARQLRGSSLLSAAAALFEQVVKLEPGRLDVRRELAEVLLALDDREKVKGLFGAEFAADAQAENVADAVEFMIKEEMFPQARRMLAAYRKKDPTNLDIMLLMLTVETGLGGQREGAKLIAESRKLADTASRYRLWLEAAVRFHEEFETTDAFLEEEEARIALVTDRDETQWEREKVFLDVAIRNDHGGAAAAIIRDDLAGDVPAERRIWLRRTLAAVLENEAGQESAALAELESLAEDDPGRASEYRAREALLHAKMQRVDLATPLLDKIEIAAIGDPELLNRLESLYTQHGRQKDAARTLKRQALLDPSNRSTWERWTGMLVGLGEEEQFRIALRRLLAGVEKMPLGDNTRRLLKGHLVDSHWRSISLLLTEDTVAARESALLLAESIERMVEDSRDVLWVSWTRAYLLNELERAAPRDEAIVKLERVAATVAASTAKTNAAAQSIHTPATNEIVFPDGLAVSLDRARELLTERAGDPSLREPVRARGPLPEFRAKWALDAGDSTPICGIDSLDAIRLLVATAGGKIMGVDKASGKKLWSTHVSDLAEQADDVLDATDDAVLPSVYRTVSRPAFPVSSYRGGGCFMPGYSGGDGQASVTPAMAIVVAGRAYAPARGRVYCISGETGRLEWLVTLDRLATGRPAAGAPAPFLFEHGEYVLAYDAGLSLAASFEAATGKLKWKTQLPVPAVQDFSWQSAGASKLGNQLLVYGAAAAILDATTGKVEWAVRKPRVKTLPFQLPEPSADKPVKASSAVQPGGYAPSRSAMLYRRSLHGYHAGFHGSSRYGSHALARQVQYTSYHPGVVHAMPYGSGMPGRPAPTRAYAAPAVAWDGAGNRYGQRLGILTPRFVLLFLPSRVTVVRRDLPLWGRSFQVSGTFVGSYESTVCMLNNGLLSNLDVVTGKTRTHALKEIMNGQRVDGRIRVAVHGPLCYVTGPRGVLCLRTRTLTKVYEASWPGAVAPDLDRPVAATFTLHGVVPSGGVVPGRCLRMIDTVDDNVLYVAVSPSRIAAIEEANAD